jgi:hypothetical protein
MRRKFLGIEGNTTGAGQNEGKGGNRENPAPLSNRE